MRNLLSSLAVFFFIFCNSTLKSENIQNVNEELGLVEILPGKVGTHWVWVSDMVWNAMPDGRATLVDADNGNMLGMLSTGYSFNSLSLPTEFREIYSAETYYSRITRGERTDVVSIYDARNLSPIAEIEIPAKRASTTPKLSTATLSDDDRFLAVWNYTPASSLSIVDVKNRKFVAEIATPGCALAFSAGDRVFLSLCGGGTIKATQLDDEGQLRQQVMSEIFFDLDSDPVTEKGVRLGCDWFFPSYEGKLHTVKYKDETFEFPEVWSLVNKSDQTDSWRIGGIQHLALHRKTKRLYALMHQGPRDTHHHPGTEVWVYDLTTKARVQKIALKKAASSILVSQDKAPLLYTVIPDFTELVVYDAVSGIHQRTIPEISLTPSLLQLPESNDFRGNCI